ncbi:MAG: hypothetical protein KGO81_03715 [Bacteroidota bacterium]|nr:hypothetical protein [Bacteroidota bacterium]
MKRSFVLLLLCFAVKGYALNVPATTDTIPTFDTSFLTPNSTVIIGGIEVSGNKKTREYIILREMTFKKGDKILLSDLNRKLVESKQLIYNTALFVDDSLYVASQKGNVVYIKINVKERWYFFPLPYFRLVDRNFNQWWVQENRSLARVNYGLKFTYSNTTGQNDKLNLWFITGYTHQLTARYDLPFFNKSLTKGINVGVSYARQHELNYATSLDNKQLFFDTPDFIIEGLRGDITYSYRPDLRQRHYFRIGYTHQSVADTVLKINPMFYPEQRTQISYIDFAYTYRYLNADYNVYPTKGILFEGSIYKRGLDKLTNLWQISTHAIYAKSFNAKTFMTLEGIASVKFPYNPYFFSQGLFGYGNSFMRGLEYYVVDGMAGGIGKISFNRQVFKYIFHPPIRTKTHDKIPFRFYLKAYADVGYAYNPYVTNNLLNNTLLHSYGVGLDVVSIYDFVFKFEFTFNQLGYNGLYLHARNDF